jgi:murein DD-endopeptidase MepM/ murein hydrolase activator NlpD
VSFVGNLVKFWRTGFGEAGEQGSIRLSKSVSIFRLTIRRIWKVEGAGETFLPFLIFSCLILHSSLLTLAQTPSQLQLELEGNIANTEALLNQREEEIANLELQLGDTAAELETQIAERDRASNDLAVLREEEVVLTESIAVLEGQLAETQAKLNELQTQVAELKARVQELLVGVYMQRTGRYASVLTQADSLHDLQIKNYYLSLLSDQDVDLVTQLSIKATELINTQDMQNQQLGELQAQKTALEANQVALEIKRSDLETIVANLESTREGQLATRKDLLESQASLETTIADLQTQRQAEIARLEEEARRKREEAARAANALEQERLQREAADAEQRATNLSAPLPEMAPGYVSPVSYAQMYAPYGECGRCLMLRANAAGAPVFAAQSGVVLTANFLSANDGYLVSVQQENGVIIAYSNLQGNTPVKIGDQVAQGDTLGYLGGGGIIPPDVLKIYVRTGRNEFVDPAPILGF